MRKITVRNRDVLVSHGNTSLRNTVLDIVEAGLNHADPYHRLHEIMHLDGDILTVGKDVFDLKKHKRIYVIGGGKATYPLAKALDEMLGERITDGVVVLKHGMEGSLEHIRIYYGSHPTPDESGLEGTKELMKIVYQTQPDDLIFSISTGGSTSLLPYPVEGITLADVKLTGKIMLQCGASMYEMNYVRNHLTRSKCGWMAKSIHKDAHIVNLGVSDGLLYPDIYTVEPTGPASSTFDDARKALTKYKLWDKIPENVAAYIRNGNESNENPHDLSDHHIYTHVVVGERAAAEGALAKARELGFNAFILSTLIDGEATESGNFLVNVAHEIQVYDAPFKKPVMMIVAGENNMQIDIPNPGTGGPSQQCALSAALSLEGIDNIVLCAVDTDGTDGPTDNAGGLVDSSSIEKANESGIDIKDYLRQFNSAEALTKMGDLVYTGHTGTNVNDLRVIAIL